MNRDTFVYNKIWSENHKYQDLSNEVIELTKDKNIVDILDLCAGGGRNTFPFINNGKNVIAVDRNEVAIQELTKLKQKFSNLKVVNCDAIDFVINDNHRYDLIILYDCIHHFIFSQKQLENYVQSLKKMMKNKGKILITFLSDINYPGGNNVPRYYLELEQAVQLFNEVFNKDFNCLQEKVEKVYFKDAQNIVDGKVVNGEYRANRLMKLYEVRT